MTIVLVTKGKREVVEKAKIIIFDDEYSAFVFCQNKNIYEKYWIKAEIVDEQKWIDLLRPENYDEQS